MFVLTEKNTVANHFLAELRDQKVQKESMRFRRNLERIGEVLAYEISKSLRYQPADVQTPLGISSTYLIENAPVLATILRAGIPFYQGFLNYFDRSETAFIGAYRAGESTVESLQINLQYVASPNIDNKPLILIDPMLATGKSLFLTYQSLLKYGTPSEIHVASVISSKHAIQFLSENIPGIKFWMGALDNDLTSNAYIVPGLGDAGDLAFGQKL